MGRSQRHRIEEQAFAASGAIYEEGAINDQVAQRLGNVIAAPPVLTSINPSSVAKGSAQFTLHALGSQFQANCAIRVNGTPVATTFVNAGDLTCLITPPANLSSWSISVQKGGALDSASKTLTFT